MKLAADVPTLPSIHQTESEAEDCLKWDKRLALAFSAHWLLTLTTAAGMYLGLGLLAPLLMMWGWQPFGRAIYALYSPFCHQFAHRSWFIFGQSYLYGYEQFLRMTSIDPITPTGRLAARGFSGNPTLGWKSAYCQRDMAIYAGVLLASLLYALLRARRIRIWRAPWLLYFLIGLAPIALDSLSQLLSQHHLLLPVLLWRESTPMLRTLTGVLFGGMNVWFAYPHIEGWMVEVRQGYVQA